MAEPTSARLLMDAARAYSRGDLNPADEAAFEDRLSHDPAARDALVEAVRWGAGPDADAIRPHPGYRAEVLRRLAPKPAWLWLHWASDWTSSRTTWTLAGAALAVALLLPAWWPTPVVPEAGPVAEEPTGENLVVEPWPLKPAKPALPWREPANGNHLVKAMEEEAARKLKQGGIRPGHLTETPMVP